MPKLGIEIKRKCKFCGKAFIIKTLDSIYCCKKCSEAAYAQKKRAEAKEKKLALIAKSVPKVREYLSIREAVAIYGVERDTLYLMVRRGQIPSINIGTRLTRINRKDLEKMFAKRPIAKHIKETPLPKKYSLEPEDCYTRGSIPRSYMPISSFRVSSGANGRYVQSGTCSKPRNRSGLTRFSVAPTTQNRIPRQHLQSHTGQQHWP